MCGVEGLARKVGDPTTELVVTRRDEASFIAVEGVLYGKFRAASIAMVWKVRWLDVIVKEEGIYPILQP